MTSYRKHNESFFDRFDESYDEILINDTSEAKAFLVEEGINPDNDVELRRKLFKKLEFKLSAIRNKQRDDELIEKAFEKLKAYIDKNKKLSGEGLKNLLHETAFAYQFRNLEKLDDEGLRELLTEIDLVKLLEEIDKTEES